MRNRSFVSAAGVAAIGLSGSASAEWRAYETPHFIIYSESKPERVEALATRLERYDGLMRMATNIGKDDPVKVRIYELADLTAVQKAAWAQNSGIAGFYSSNVMGPFLVTPRNSNEGGRYFTPELVLQHEYAHHFMLQYFPAIYPSWYIEGFAELVGSSTTEKDGSIRYGEPARHRGNDIVAYWVPLGELLTRDKHTYFDTYGQGWAMTHYLTFDKERSKQLRQYLANLSAGQTTADAARSAFGDLNQLNQAARRYVGNGTFPVRQVKIEVKQPAVSSSRALSPGEAALVPEVAAFTDSDLTAIRKPSDRERARKERQKLFETIKEKVARLPNDPFAQHMLAESATVVGDRAEAIRATARLLALDPKPVRGLVRHSLLLSESARALPPAERGKKAAEARHVATRANRLDNNDPLPLIAYYQSFNLAGEPPTRQAVIGLAQAQATLPDNDPIRLLLVEQYARDKKFAQAIATLMPLANSPHESPQRDSARERMTRLRSEAGALVSKPAAAARAPAPAG
jgi:hypothetical protein